jgi:hypothetical protein
MCAAVDASVAMYRRVELELLPTPAKSHYTFNLRDLSKVFQGTRSCSPPARRPAPAPLSPLLSSHVPATSAATHCDS